MSDDKYRQVSAQRENCKQGHWTGTPKGSVNKSGCWLCKCGCAILSYLKWKNLEPNEANVTKYLNNNADVVWSTMGLSQSSTFKAPSIGKFKSKSHYVYIKDNNCNIFDPGSRNNTSMSKNDFACFYY